MFLLVLLIIPPKSPKAYFVVFLFHGLVETSVLTPPNTQHNQEKGGFKCHLLWLLLFV